MRSGSSDRIFMLIGLLLVALLAPRARATGIFVQPANFYLTAERGSSVEAHLEIAPSAGDTEVRVSVSPFTIDEHGKPSSCRCRGDRSLVAWSEISAGRLSLRAGHYEPVTLRMEVPQSAEGSYWAAVMIDLESDPNAAGVTTRSRVAVPVFMTVAGTEFPHAKLVDLSATIADGEVVVGGTVVNDGNTLLHTPLVIALNDHSSIDAAEVASIDDAVVTVLPGEKRTFRLRLRGGSAAPADLRATVWFRFASAPDGVVEASCDVSSRCRAEGCAGL